MKTKPGRKNRPGKTEATPNHLFNLDKACATTFSRNVNNKIEFFEIMPNSSFVV